MLIGGGLFDRKGLSDMTTSRIKKPRGFASLTPERLKEIASKGGKSVKPENRTYYRDTDYAQECGRKGGLVKKNKGVEICQ